MTTLHRRQTKLIALAASCCMLSACVSLPFVSDDLEEPLALANEHEKSVEQAMLEADLREFKNLKPSLMRLVELEADLAFLLEEMSDFKEQEPMMFEESPRFIGNENAGRGQIIYASDGSTEVDAKTLSSAWDNEPLSPDKFDIASEIQDMSQSQVTTNQSAIEASSISSIDAKFSTVATQNASEVEINAAKKPLVIDNASTRVDTMADKFSSASKAGLSYAQTSTCAKWQEDSQAIYALHLASYSTREAAQQGWKSLNQKYADTWCQTNARLAKVTVNGKEFLSLRIGAYASRDKVKALCSLIKSSGDYCGISTVEGQLL